MRCQDHRLAEEDDDEVSPYADVMIRLPKVSTLLQPLVATVPLQMFACELATKKGHDATSHATSPSQSRSSRARMSRLLSITLRASGIARRRTEPASASASRGWARSEQSFLDCSLAADRAEPSTLSSLADQKRVGSLLRSTAPRDPVRATTAADPRAMREQRPNKAHDRRRSASTSVTSIGSPRRSSAGLVSSGGSSPPPGRAPDGVKGCAIRREGGIGEGVGRA